MKILKIHTRRRSLYAIAFDELIENEEAKLDESGYLLIDRTAFDETGYAVGRELCDDELCELIFRSAYYRARERAFYHLSRRDFSKKEMADKLRREFGDSAAKAAADRMVELGLINDESYAERYAEIMLNIKQWSPSRAVRELVTRGIDRDFAKSAVDAVNRDPKDMIRQLIDKKYAQKLATGGLKAAASVSNSLARKGYLFSDIRAVIGEYLNENELYD